VLKDEGSYEKHIKDNIDLIKENTIEPGELLCSSILKIIKPQNKKYEPLQ